ncbi:MAG: hypothetical protein Q8940_17700 [Bacteroidota bacterium]|nr:hypothetical protein [Bacteroidota bacterium]
MEDKAKNEFDSLAVLWSGAWDNFKFRRNLELKFSFAIWAALGTFIGTILSGKITLNGYFVLQGTIIIGGLLLILHVVWTYGIGRANNYDRKIALHYERTMQALSKSEFSSELNKELEQGRKNMGKLLSNWSHVTQIFITLLLYVGSILSVASQLKS